MEFTFEPQGDREMDRKSGSRGESTTEPRVEIPYQVKLDVFEGPLDLLLHLIRKNEVDIYNIPIALITEQYLGTLDLMRNLNLDVAGEFVLMAATLAYIKSRTLLPPRETEEEEEDPRDDLVRQLLEYERFKDAAEQLEARPQLRREVFVRGGEVADTDVPLEEQELAEISVFALLDAFRKVWERAPAESFHEITGEKISLRDKINEILERLESVDNITFEDLLADASISRHVLVVTFLALLELTRLRIVRIFQAARFGPIRLQKAVSILPADRDAIARGLDEESRAGEVSGEGDADLGEGEADLGEGKADSGEGEAPAEPPRTDDAPESGTTGPAGERTDVRPEGDDPEEGS